MYIDLMSANRSTYPESCHPQDRHHPDTILPTASTVSQASPIGNTCTGTCFLALYADTKCSYDLMLCHIINKPDGALWIPNSSSSLSHIMTKTTAAVPLPPRLATAP